MTLPVSRNNTYSDASPVRSADLNDLQDCIIAGKHGAITLSLGAAAFQCEDAKGHMENAGNNSFPWLRVASGETAARWHCPLPLPEGAVIETVQVHLYRPVVPNVPGIWLSSVLFDGSGVGNETVYNFNTQIAAIASGTAAVMTSTALNYAVPANRFLTITVNLEPGNTVQGARITYRKP